MTSKSLADLRREHFGNGSEYDYLSSVKVNTEVDEIVARHLIELLNTDVNGFVVKVAGNDTLYGRGQAFMVLEEGAGDATDQTSAGSILFRIDARGGVGTTGGVHVATGLRKPSGGNQAVWIDPSENIVGLVIDNPEVSESAVWDKDFFLIRDRRNADALVFRVKSDGTVESTMEIAARKGQASQVVLGTFFGAPSISLGLAGAFSMVFGAGQDVVGISSGLEMIEMAEPAAPTANRARLFIKDNGAGKTQLCVRFNTGATAVLATQP